MPPATPRVRTGRLQVHQHDLAAKPPPTREDLDLRESVPPSSSEGSSPPPRSPVGAVRLLGDEPELLHVVVQPILDLARGVVAGYECLARCPSEWNLAPDTLFAAARPLGLASRLQRRVLRQVLDLRHTIPENRFMTVNVEPLDLLDPSLIDTLTGHGSLQGVLIEVTERAWPDDEDRLEAALARLREAGALIALDDAGTGYSDLTRLMKLRPDMVKLDHHLIEDLESDPATQALVAMMGELAGQMDAWLVVEGIERPGQLGVLARMGVPLGQGFLLGEPAPPWPDATVAQEHRTVLQQATVRDSILSVMQPAATVADLRLVGEPRAAGRSLAMGPSTPIPVALRRALSRPVAERFKPFLVTGADGEILGFVPMENLILAQLDTSVARLGDPRSAAAIRHDQSSSWST